MRKLLLVVGIMLLVIGGLSYESLAQLGIGIKVPSTTVFVSNRIDPDTIIELGASLGALTNSIIAMSVDGKIYFSEVRPGIVLYPFMGLGMGISFVGGTIFLSPFLLMGADTPIPNSPLSGFLELGLGVTFSSLGIGIVPSGELGLRFDF